MTHADITLICQEIGKAIRERIEDETRPLLERMSALEAKTQGMQDRLDKCLSFAGEWQCALDYRPGTLVRRGQEVFVSVRHVRSGGTLAARDGSGWERIV